MDEVEVVSGWRYCNTCGYDGDSGGGSTIMVVVAVSWHRYGDGGEW